MGSKDLYLKYKRGETIAARPVLTALSSLFLQMLYQTFLTPLIVYDKFPMKNFNFFNKWANQDQCRDEVSC